MDTTTNTASKPAHPRWVRIIADIFHTGVMILSVALIVYISYDTFQNIPFLESHHYMTFQFWVCIFFLVDFFVDLAIVDDKKRYLKDRWFFFLISIPFLNIITLTNLKISGHLLYFIRFLPLIRGAYALSIVTGYVSRNRALSLLAQYLVILLTIIYISSLIFYYEEHSVNSYVKEYWDALYWACMNCSTVGCYFSAVTPVGKVISVILPTAGMMMLPLFTVFVINSVKQFDDRRVTVEAKESSDANAADNASSSDNK